MSIERFKHVDSAWFDDHYGLSLFSGFDNRICPTLGEDITVEEFNELMDRLVADVEMTRRKALADYRK